MSLGDVAAQMQWPVFACGIDKKPVVATGFKAATCDAIAIKRQFDNPAAAMIGVPTGNVSGLLVIDIDIKTGRDGRAWLDENADALPQTRTHKTQSGGLHLVFQMPEGIDIRNSAGRVAPGVDVRGNGGYVIVPPSPGYTVADDCEPAEMPRWLVRACMPPEAPAVAPRVQERHEKYVQKIIDNEVLAVIRSGEGTRNDTLNKAAFALGTLVAAKQITRQSAESDLMHAGNLAGLTTRECLATIKSGLDAGVDHPREIPSTTSAKTSANGTQHTENKTNNRTGQTASKPLVWFDEIQPCLDTLDFVEGVLVEQGAAVVYGESNAGKTFWTTDLALHVAAGLKWNGREVEQGGVIYCVLEGGNGFNNRVAAWRKAKGVSGIPFAARQASLNLLNPAVDLDALIDLINEAKKTITVPVKLVVIDTLARAFAGGNENASEDMGALVINMDRIRRETGASVLFVHHSGKDAAKGARGHSSLRAALDTEIEVVASEDTDDKTATVVKQRELPKGDSFGFKLDVVELGQNRRGKPVTTCLVTHCHAEIAPIKRHKKRLSPASQLAIRALSDAINNEGALLPRLSPFPNKDTRAASATAWRNAYYALKSGTPENNRQSFGRAETELLAAGVIDTHNGLLWFIERDSA